LAARVGFFTTERGDDEARVGFAERPFRLGDDPSVARPAIQGRPWKLLEAPRRLSARFRRALGCGKLVLDHRSKARIARQTEEVAAAPPNFLRALGDPDKPLSESAAKAPTLQYMCRINC
jgi:hypothetical protein